MSDDIDLDAIDTSGDESGPKPLREAFDKARARIKELESAVAEKDVALRGHQINDFARDLDVPAKAMKYLSRDLADADEVSADTVRSWLEENGEDFGWTPPSADGLDDDAVAAAQRAADFTARVPQSGNGSGMDLLNRLRSADASELAKAGLI